MKYYYEKDDPSPNSSEASGENPLCPPRRTQKIETDSGISS